MPKAFIFSISEKIETFVIKICKLYIFYFQIPFGCSFPTTPNLLISFKIFLKSCSGWKISALNINCT